MDYATIVAIIFGSLGVCGTIIVCTVKVTAKIVSMESAITKIASEVSDLRRQQQITCDSVAEHAAACDKDRSDQGHSLGMHERRLDKHSSQLGELGAT